MSYSNTGLSTPTTYLWSNGGTTPSTSALTSGAYNVTVEDVHSCRFVTLTDDVTIYEIPDIQISGRLDYCEGEDIRLSGDAGEAMGITHTWKRGSTTITPGTLMTETQPAGTYTYTLELSYPAASCCTCTRVVGPVTVTVYPQPSPPGVTALTGNSCIPYEVELTGTAPGSPPAAGTLNWSNGTTGTTTTVTEGGMYRLWYTNAGGCISHTDTTVPESPEHYFAWFPEGCYEFCSGKFSFDLFGPPGQFDYWNWIKVGTSSTSGTDSKVDPYTISGAGSYQLELDNGLCRDTTGTLSISTYNCSGCGTPISAYSFTCDPDRPGGYILDLTLSNGSSNTLTYTIGLTSGPAVPFQATLAPGVHALTLNVTIMQPPPIYIEVTWWDPNTGKYCYQKVWIDPSYYDYPCDWSEQKNGGENSGNTAENRNNGRGSKLQQGTGSGMLCYPNPAAQQLSINYHYGDVPGKDRRLLVYDVSGRKIAAVSLPQAAGTQVLDVGSWMPGVYTVRMEADGKAIQTQRITVNH